MPVYVVRISIEKSRQLKQCLLQMCKVFPINKIQVLLLFFSFAQFPLVLIRSEKSEPIMLNLGDDIIKLMHALYLDTQR